MTNSQRLKAIIRIFRKIIQYPSSIFLVLNDETEFEKYLRKKYHKTQFPTIDINHFLQNRACDINHYTFLDGSSLITDLALLKSVAHSIPNCEYLEIGTWRGESILNVADTAASCTSINLSPEQIIELGFPQKYALLHGCLITNPDKIKTIHANSLTFDFTKLYKKYDFIFVDGDHTYNAVKSDSANVFKLLKDENSVIIWHDYGYNPEAPRHSVIAAILDSIPVSEHKNLYHVSNTICAIYTQKKYKTTQLESPVSPDKTFQISIQNQPFKVK